MPTYKNRSCYFCDNDITYIDYKNVRLLEERTTKYNKITPRYYTGTCLKHQKMLTRGIKNAREIGLLPYTT